MDTTPPLVPVSVGELADKITILQIKLEMITDPQKRANVEKELSELHQVFVKSVSQTPEVVDLVNRMKVVNLEIWHLSDRIHACEKKNEVTPEDIHFYRVIHTKNDERFVLKKEINALASSHLVEEKSYDGL